MLAVLRMSISQPRGSNGKRVLKLNKFGLNRLIMATLISCPGCLDRFGYRFV